jgi:dihydrofolate reductase
MRTSAFVGVSVDGFLARPDGALDFLPEEPEDHGYEAFFASVDALLFGRATYDTVLGFGSWPYAGKRVFVASSRELPPPPPGGAVERVNGEPAEIVTRLESLGFQHVYVDGGVVIQSFLRVGLLDRLIVTRVPVLIGEGRSLFGPTGHDVRLKHVATLTYPSGLVQSEYELERGTR